MVMAAQEEKTIADVLQRLMRSARPAGDLTAEQARLLGDALMKLARDFPRIADRTSAFVEHTALVRAAHKIRSGDAGRMGLPFDGEEVADEGVGTWQQLTKDYYKEVDDFIKTRLMAQETNR